MGASGAVGSAAVQRLLSIPEVTKISSLGRRIIPDLDAQVAQHSVDIHDPSSYRTLLDGHNTALCTLGVGQPSKVSFEEFVSIDKTAVLAFANECKRAGVKHFELLGAVASNSKSKYKYLRTKGELVDGLKALTFERLSIFQPSMILTPTNRYGIGQAITLKVWPVLHGLMHRGWRQYRGIKVEKLGAAMANNVTVAGQGTELLHYDDFLQRCSSQGLPK
jgi:uncharacterized protein YbjT (DUF2867 family)